MSKIKLVAWDVYGTIIEPGHSETSDVEELEHTRTRPGVLEALKEIKSRDIIQVTCSDGDLGNLKANLKEAGIDWRDFFNDLYKMTPLEPKDFSYILQDYQIKPKNLLVIGDNYDIDIAFAKKQGCSAFYIPESEKQGFNSVNLEKLIGIIEEK